MRKLTKKERSAIARLKRAAKDWPDTLWLFAGDADCINVMMVGEDGERMFRGDYGGADQDYLVDEINIPSDGGGW